MAVPCPIAECNANLESIEAVDSHLKTFHYGVLSFMRAAGINLLCKLCPGESFTGKQRFIGHLNTIHSELSASSINAREQFEALQFEAPPIEEDTLMETEEPTTIEQDGIELADDNSLGEEQEGTLQKSIKALAGYLLGHLNITGVNVSDIFSELQQIVNLVIDQGTSKEEFDDLLSSLKTAYFRKQWLAKETGFVEPIEKKMGEFIEAGRIGPYAMQVDRPFLFYTVPMREVLTNVLSNPSVQKHLILPSEYSFGDSLKTAFDGEKFRSLPVLPEGEEYLLLAPYYDDAAPGNPIGTKSTQNNIAYFLFNILNLPRFLNSTNRFAFLYSTAYSSDQKLYDYEPIARNLKSELIQLYEEGLLIMVKEKPITFRPILFTFLGDNLAIHAVFRLNCSFSTGFICRSCKMRYEDLSNFTSVRAIESIHLSYYRTEEEYDRVVAEANFPSMGFRQECVLNELPHFHINSNYSHDIMHDIFEGEARKVIALVVHYLNKRHRISLEKLNKTIVNFGYGFYDKSNKPGTFGAKILQDGMISQRASQCYTLLRLLPLIFREWIAKLEEDDIVMRHFGYFSEFVGVLMMPLMTTDESELINKFASRYVQNISKVIEHLESLQILPSFFKMTPKTHYLLHYGRMARALGPPVHYWTMNFEQMHAMGKRLSYISRNMKNIPKSMAIRYQQENATSWLRSSNDIATYRKLAEASPELSRIINNIMRNKGLIFVAIALEYKGTHYRPETAVIHELNEFGNIHTFARIQATIRIDGEWFLLCNELPVIEYSTQHASYRVGAIENWLLISLEHLSNYHPLDVYNLGEANIFYIPLRHYPTML